MPFCFNDISSPSSGVTERRIDKVVDLATGLVDNKLCVFSAGFSKENPHQPTKKSRAKRIRPLSVQMANYLREQDPTGIIKIYCGPLGWGTLSEMIWTIRIARDKCHFDNDTTVIVVSSKDHLPRIRKYAWWIMPKEWWVQYHAIDHRLNEPIREQIKFLKDLPKLVWCRLKIALGFPL